VLVRGPTRITTAAAGLIGVQIAWWASVGVPGYFRRDDFFYIDEARHTGLWDWLGRIYWEHFAPGHRFAFWLVGDATRAGWDLLQLGLLALFALGLVCLYGSLVLLYGRSWWLLVPLAVAGFAWQFSLGFTWPSAGLQVIPEFAFGSACVYAFLRHLQSNRSLWLALSALAFALGLAFYIRMLLVPVLLVAIRYLFLERDLRLRTVWEERGRWVVFLIPALIYVAYFWSRHAFESPAPGSLGDVVTFLRVSWAENVVPGFLGVRMGTNPSLMMPGVGAEAWRTVIAAGGEALLVLLIVISFARKGAAAWRAWGYVLAAVGITFVVTARGKLSIGGTGVAYDPRYVSNLCWQLPLGLIFAVHPRRVLELGADWPDTAPRRGTAVVVAIALAASIALATTTAASVDRDWQAAGSR
jgi:hypothetical protein